MTKESYRAGAISSWRNKGWNLRLDPTDCPTSVHHWQEYCSQHGETPYDQWQTTAEQKRQKLSNKSALSLALKKPNP